MTYYEKVLGLQTTGEDREITNEVIALLRKKGITVDRASKILSDARIIIPLVTKLE